MEALRQACQRVGFDDASADLIRDGENALYRLPGGVARIARAGQEAAAHKEVQVARWLHRAGVPVVRPLDGVEAPILVGDRAVTFWHELPPHEQGTTTDVATLLRELHSLDPPSSLDLPDLAPFVRVAHRIDGSTSLTPPERQWLHKRLSELEDAYADLPRGIPWRLVHGDAWRGNVASTAEGVLLLDFERCAYGPPEWDLVSTAVSRVTTGWLDAQTWTEYCRTYGYDVTTWEGFEVLRDIRELRMTTTAAQVAEKNPAAHPQFAHRLACLQGHNGPRPWSGWHPVP